MIRLVFLLLFLTGATGLIYQVTWQKYLAILLGSHAASTAVILALFFVFLSLGYSVIGKYSTRIMKNQLVLYGLIELLIGVYALYSHSFFNGIYSFFVEQSQGSDGGLGFALLVCGAFIGFPTFLMGGTIPVLTQALSKTHDLSGDIHARVYGLNTLGAVFGCLLAGFYLIENYGLEDTLLFAGNINVAIFIASLWIVKKTALPFSGPALEKATPPRVENAMWLVAVSFLSGFYTFGFETILIRMVSFSVGSTSYVYATVVGAFVLAIAVGSLVIARSKRATEPRFLVYTLTGAIVSMWAIYMTIPEWPIWFYRLRILFLPMNFNFAAYNLSLLLFTFLILILPISLIGSNLPILFNVLQNRGRDISGLVGRLYSVNSVGSGLGAVFIGYLAFKIFDASVIYQICLLSLVLATGISVIIIFRGRERLGFSAGLGALALLILFSPGWPDSKFLPGRHTWSTPTGTFSDLEAAYKVMEGKSEILYSKYDTNTHASVLKPASGGRSLLVNGKVDAAAGTSRSDSGVRAMAALTPMAIKSDLVEDIFIVGLGAGLSTGIFASFPEVKRIDVAEISEGVTEALPLFDEFNYDIVDNMEKINLRVGDAYRELMLTGHQYDLIVSEPSNPWVSGSEKIFTEEFYNLAKSRLKEGGFYVQWFPLFYMPESTFSKILRTYQSVFPETLVFAAGNGTLTLVGASEPWALDDDLIEKRFKSFPKAYNDLGYTSPQSIWMKQLLSPLEVKLLAFGDGGNHSLFNPDLEYKAGRAYFAGENSSLGNLLLWKTVLPMDRTNMKDGKYLFEKFSGSISEAAFLEASKTTQSSYWGFYYPRLLLQYLRLHPGGKEFKKDLRGLREVKYLIGLEDSWNREAVESIPEAHFRKVVSNFRMLQSIGELPRLGRLQKLLDLYCPGENCKARLKDCLEVIGPRDVTEALKGKSLAEVSLPALEARWKEVTATFKKIGSY